MKKAYFCTAEELEQRGKDNLPKPFQSGEHLIYKESGACNPRFDHADRGTGVLWKKYVHDQFNERI